MGFVIGALLFGLLAFLAWAAAKGRMTALLMSLAYG